MLKTIHPLLNADLLYALAAMGHGDEIALVDCNFPAASHARRLIRLDAVDTTEAADAIFSVFPLDTFVDRPIVRMELVGDPETVPPVQKALHRLAEEREGREIDVEPLDRNAFYERARSAFATVATGDQRPYGCFLLVKGVWYTSNGIESDG
jgi:L-fucose mutarotase